MKRLSLLIAANLISVMALAATANERKAANMMAVLHSQEIRPLLAQIDGVGSLSGIRYVSSGRAAFGPDIYEVNFLSYSGPVQHNCAYVAEVNIQTSQVIGFVPNGPCKDVR